MTRTCPTHMIFACDNKYGIGFDKSLPNWNLRNDLHRFKTLTTGEGDNFIIMGKTTWLSLNKRPLPNRINIILSTTLDKNINYNNVVVKETKEEIDEYIEEYKKKNSQVWIIGGAQVYKSYLHEVDNIYWSHAADCFTANVFLDNEVITFLDNQQWNINKTYEHSYMCDMYTFKMSTVKK